MSTCMHQTKVYNFIQDMPVVHMTRLCQKQTKVYNFIQDMPVVHMTRLCQKQNQSSAGLGN